MMDVVKPLKLSVKYKMLFWVLSLIPISCQRSSLKGPEKLPNPSSSLRVNVVMLNCSYLPLGGWVHSVSFSGDGGRVCWVGHDSSLTVADASREMAKSQLKTKYLPFTAVTWVSQNSLVAVVGILCKAAHSWLYPELTYPLPWSQVLICSFSCFYMLTSLVPCHTIFCFFLHAENVCSFTF